MCIRDSKMIAAKDRQIQKAKELLKISQVQITSLQDQFTKEKEAVSALEKKISVLNILSSAMKKLESASSTGLTSFSTNNKRVHANLKSSSALTSSRNLIPTTSSDKSEKRRDVKSCLLYTSPSPRDQA
eukprot:TRINITY_DN17849_c0_g1_i1.p1 TRINITY_DN17849_c0_g1~~TRINITY_DN17849_c0_g1_i1.p1  ORF type:complete len:129 (+),score=31.11 TRINITY_DN17849_c0_g1_i1:64-450(+)